MLIPSGRELTIVISPEASSASMTSLSETSGLEKATLSLIEPANRKGS